MRGLAILAVVSGCVTSVVVPCDFGVCPENTVCDEAHELCVSPQQVASCDTAANGMSCTITEADDGTCDQGVCLVDRCGDGYRQGTEVCDGADLGDTLSCTGLGFYDDVSTACRTDCTYDTSVCTGFCGDDAVEPGIEFCEPALGPPNQTCVERGFDAGFLGCSTTCGLDIDDCKTFGWTVPRYLNALTALHATSEDNIWVAGSSTQTITHFDGFDWTTYDACMTVQAVWSPGPGTAYVGGNAGVALVTPTGCTLMPNSGTLVDAIWGTGPNNIYATDLQSIIHFDGTAWTTEVAQLPISEGAVWGSGPDDVWASHGDQLRHWNGTTWETPSTGLPALLIRAITGTSAMDVYIGGRTPSTTTARVYRYDGATWTEMHAFSGEVHSASAANGRVYVAGQRSSDASVTYVYDGYEWNDLMMSGMDPIRNLVALPTGRVYSISRGRSRINRYEGNALLPGPAGGFGPNTLGFVYARNPTELYAIATENAFVTTYRLFTSNGGTWTQVSGMDGTKAISIVPTKTRPMLAIGTTGLYRDDGGLGFTLVDGTVTTGSMLWAATRDDAWVVISPNVLRHWNGSVIEAACATCTPPQVFIRAIWGSGPSDVYAVGNTTGTNATGVILRWDGNTWSPVTMPAVAHLQAVWGTAPNNVYAVGELGTVLHYDGSTWSDISIPVSTTLYAVHGTAPTDLFVAGGDGLIFHRDEAGRWAPVSSGTTQTIQSFAPYGDTVLYPESGSATRRLIRNAPW